ncbi:MAG: 4-hydroxythreonine-4-phosphate dehydrogenase PdxA [Planctomycetota bacterium]|jgi:4-hydroxythreonine-4-phosphate dehydrogenase
MKVIAVTPGDPAGIGPEVLVKALKSEGLVWNEISGKAIIVVFGSKKVLEETCKRLKIECNPTAVEKTFRKEDLKELNIVDLGGKQDFTFGEASKSSGLHAMRAIDAAAEAACSGMVDALVTMPVSKNALNLAGISLPGHTEILREKAGVSRTTMLLANDLLRFALVTTHLAIRDVPPAVTEENVAHTIRAAEKGLRELYRIPNPRIGVMALNPHGGENGIFGSDERDVIIPAIKRAQSEGINARGPFPADVATSMMNHGSFDVLVAMFHDQALVPLKLINGESGINVTFGLPFIRTSPLHGTAFDIAGKNLANPISALAAIRAAVAFTGE